MPVQAATPVYRFAAAAYFRLSAASRISPVLVALVDGRVSALVRTSDVVAAIRP